MLQRIPNEILSYIFLFTIQGNEYRDDPFFMPLTISHTCKKWRDVSLSTGALWTDVVITTFDLAVIRRVHACLSRSGNHPLTILLDFHDNNWNWDENTHPFGAGQMKVLLSLLIPHAARWKSFELRTDTWEPIHTFLSTTSTQVTPTPLLQSLTLTRCNEYFVGRGQIFLPVESKQPIPLFGGMSLQNLRQVSLAGVHVDWTKSSLRNLRKLEFKYHAYEVMPSLQEFVDILSSCPDLDTLSILGWGPRLDGQNRSGNPNLSNLTTPSTTNPIVLEKLVTFSFGFVDVQYGLNLLSLFRLPSLKDFHLEDLMASADPDGSGPSDASPILDWLATASAYNSHSDMYYNNLAEEDSDPDFSVQTDHHHLGSTVAGHPSSALVPVSVSVPVTSPSSSSSPFSSFPSLSSTPVTVNDNRVPGGVGCTLPLSNVTHLGLTGISSPSSSESAFSRFLRTFSSVEKMCLIDMDMRFSIPSLIDNLDLKEFREEEEEGTNQMMMITRRWIFRDVVGELEDCVHEEVKSNSGGSGLDSRTSSNSSSSNPSRRGRRESVSLGLTTTTTVSTTTATATAVAPVTVSDRPLFPRLVQVLHHETRPVQMKNQIEATPPLVEDDEDLEDEDVSFSSHGGASESLDDDDDNVININRRRQVFEESGVEVFITNVNDDGLRGDEGNITSGGHGGDIDGGGFEK
ncbi:hypothetical protein K435DRAFT_782082 [Dendrothele bispora CBS 962.96]|uniref:Uncharacterized protein n=1 Tax=Dendrothele bispora (strain CBS 962.96) TaxID=1314807 RepID=A0A4S8LHS8_DENBC|nr:hypothetical protein K435DRAFT_782082 [Dendrothele bispora CBS 962.96]